MGRAGKILYDAFLECLLNSEHLQTFGGPFESDGRLQGDEMIYTYTCDTVNNVCAIPMPAPAVALVFLNSNALSESEPTTTVTFATTTTAVSFCILVSGAHCC